MSSAKKWDVKVNIIPKKPKAAENTDSTTLNAITSVEQNSENLVINKENSSKPINLYEDLTSDNFFNKNEKISENSDSSVIENINNDNDLSKIVIKSNRKVPIIPEAADETVEALKHEPSVKNEYDENFFKKKEENKLDDYLPELELFYKYDKDTTANQNKSVIKEEKIMIEKDNNPANVNKKDSVLFDVNNLDLSGFNEFSANEAAKVETPVPIENEVKAEESEVKLSKKELKEIEKNKKAEAERLAKEKEIEAKRLEKEKKLQDKLAKKNKKGEKVSEIEDESLKAKSLKEVKAQSKTLGYMLSNGEKIYRSYKYNASSSERIDVTNKRVVCVNKGYQQIEINEITGLNSKFKRETKASFILIGLLLIFIAAAGAAIVLNYIPLQQSNWLTSRNWLKYLIYSGSGIFALIGIILLFKCSVKDFYINIFTKPQEMFFTIKSRSTPKYKTDDNLVSVKANKDAYLVVAELGAAILNIKEYNKRQEKKI